MNLTAGTKPGRYEILSPLGAGGVGETYLSQDFDRILKRRTKHGVNKQLRGQKFRNDFTWPMVDSHRALAVA
jgi:hypothetical protein